jgi:tetratricopeptide (TPR) repeat protein
MRRHRPVLWLANLVALMCFAVLATAARAPSPRMSPADSIARARTLTEWGWEAVADTAVESRQRAIRDLQTALRLDPTNASTWRALGRTYELGQYRKQARECYRRAIAMAPRAPDGYMDLGMAWKREFLMVLDRNALDSAMACFDTLNRLRPYAADGWLRLAPLRYEHGDLAGAAQAAARALAGRPRRPISALAAACMAYRTGDLERADSLYAATIPRLDPSLRSLLERPTWLGIGAAGVAGDPWAGLDPDPTTPQNEARLEYWSRVTYAYLLFYDPLRPALDARAQTYVRYGPPSGVALNPQGAPTSFRYNTGNKGRGGVPAEYPADAMVWSYPDLGMRVVLQDRSLMGDFQPAATKDFDPLSVPHVEGRQDLLTLQNGAMVLPTLPPRSQRIEVRGLVARFEGAHRPRFLAQVQAPGGPADTLWARCVVLDSTGREIQRTDRRLEVSACDPAATRVADFAAELPPGAFDVTISVRGGHKRGLFRAPTRLDPLPRGLALSDIVLACGDPGLMVSASGVRLEANVEARNRGRQPLSAYFEIYRLVEGADHLTHFEYEYTVRRMGKEPTGLARFFVLPEAPVISQTTREEAQMGALRRQFVTVPTQSLAPARYRLEIRVRDQVTGAAVSGTVEFERE